MLDLIPLDDISAILSEFRRVLKPVGRMELLNMSKKQTQITPAESGKTFQQLPAAIVLLVFGMCRTVLVKELVTEVGFAHVSRTFIPGTVAYAPITARKTS